VSDSVPTPANQADPILAEHAVAIQALGKRALDDLIEIGRRLTECKRICGHGNWLPWLGREFGCSGSTALRYVRELDELVFLNRGAPEGGHTKHVELTVAQAEAGVPVSAVAWNRIGVPPPDEIEPSDFDAVLKPSHERAAPDFLDRTREAAP